MTTLVVIDIQKEYNTPGRPYYLKGIEPSLEKCRTLLAFARKNHWNVIHIQHSNGNTAPRFNPTETYFDFIEGFEPLAGEEHYVKNDFSCYSSHAFSGKMNSLFSTQNNPVILMGYNSVMCCLSTLEEARRRKHSMILVSDACLAKDVGAGDENTMHTTMLNIYKAKALAEIKTTEEVILSYSS